MLNAVRERAFDLLHRVHFAAVHRRRIEALARELAARIPAGARTVLDVGSGDGLLASRIRSYRPGLEITGVDIVPRREAFIPVTLFDGYTLPFDDRSFDTVLFVDVLHHATHQRRLLSEARRVAREVVVVKDHLQESRLDRATLRAMDWVGNRHNDVPLPYDYWSADRWRRTFDEVHLDVIDFDGRVPVYGGVANLLFGRGLHVVAVARPRL